MLPSAQPTTELTRPEITKLFRRNRGAAAAVARELGVSAVTVSLWLRRKRNSARLDREIRAFAQGLVEREAQRAV